MDRFVNLLSSIDHTADNDCIDELVVSFTNVIQGCADPLFSRHINVKPNASLTKGNIPWMTPECKQLKHDFMLCLNEYRNTKTDESRREMVQVRNKYTKCANKCRFNHNKLKTERLVNAQKQNSKE